MIPSFVIYVIDCLEIRSKFMGSRFRVSPSGVVPFDYVRKGSVGSVGSVGSKGLVRRIKIRSAAEV